MYWCKSGLNSVNYAALVLLISCLAACKPDIKKSNFFDIAGYFTKEAVRLKKQNKPIFKTVEHNGVTESKKIIIKDWNAELSLFEQSDINKPAWRYNYIVQEDTGFVTYRAKDPELKTREIMIKRTNGKVKWILIINHTKNLLYETREKLSYFPDSLYLIEKMQAVHVIGINRYRIQGNFNQ